MKILLEQCESMDPEGISKWSWGYMKISPKEDLPISYRCECGHDCCGHLQCDIRLVHLTSDLYWFRKHEFRNV